MADAQEDTQEDIQEYTIGDIVANLTTMDKDRKTDLKQVKANMKLLEEKVM